MRQQDYLQPQNIDANTLKKLIHGRNMMEKTPVKKLILEITCPKCDSPMVRYIKKHHIIIMDSWRVKDGLHTVEFCHQCDVCKEVSYYELL
jgi:RNase P subunit RPR2